MTKVAILANCQGGPLRRMIEACLPGVTAVLVSNSPRAGGFDGPERAADSLGAHDVIIHQALGRGHGPLSDAAIAARYGGKTLLRFAYIYNSGIGALGYAPQSPRNSYGEVIGEAMIIAMIREGLSEDEIVTRVADGAGQPDVVDRFAHDLAEMRRRETALDLKLCDFIATAYRTDPLFLTHNHPTFALSAELLRQVVRAIAPGHVADAADRLRQLNPRIADLPTTGAPISPDDARRHGYQFGHHSDWAGKQRHLISLVWRTHALGQSVEPSVFASNVRLPDCPVKL